MISPSSLRWRMNADDPLFTSALIPVSFLANAAPWRQLPALKLSGDPHHKGRPDTGDHKPGKNHASNPPEKSHHQTDAFQCEPPARAKNYQSHHGLRGNTPPHAHRLH